MKTYYAAADIGASGGRLILGALEDGQLTLETIHRFDNRMEKRGDALCWDYQRIAENIVEGLRLCAEAGKIPVSLGVDTWGVDYVLLDEAGNPVGECYGYRDHRTDGMDRVVEKIIAPEELYRRTGTLKADYNTIYQLMSVRERSPEHLEAAQCMLLTPDYLNYLLTGVKKWEYTEASTTQLLDPEKKDWDFDLIRSLGLPEKLFGPVSFPGTYVGKLAEHWAKKAGYSLDVYLPGTHDTACAVAALPKVESESIYISSGTWSLMGVRREKPDCSEESRKANLTNEGSADGGICCHKNIMGLWMIQSVRHEYGDRYSFDEICRMAEESKDFPSLVDVQDNCFLSPDSMCESIRTWCEAHGLKVPQTLGEIASVVYRSLAACYAQTAKELETLNGKPYPVVQVVGGGSQAEYLNQLTADALGKTVYAGPTEASAIGNIIVQMWGRGGIGSLDEARQIVGSSFPVKVFQPRS
jgi:rhamnulokinase